jgi:hypothetical protein
MNRDEAVEQVKRLRRLEQLTRDHAEYGRPLAGPWGVALGVWAAAAILLRVRLGAWGWLPVYSTPLMALVLGLVGHRLARLTPAPEVVHARRLRVFGALLDVLICAMGVGRLAEGWRWFAQGGVRWGMFAAAAAVGLAFVGLYAWRYVHGRLTNAALRPLLVLFLSDGGAAPWRAKGNVVSLAALLFAALLVVLGSMDFRAHRQAERELARRAGQGVT